MRCSFESYAMPNGNTREQVTGVMGKVDLGTYDTRIVASGSKSAIVSIVKQLVYCDLRRHHLRPYIDKS